MNITIVENGKRVNAPATPGDTILTVLQRAGIRSLHAPCGGRGTCKKCLVTVSSSSFNGTCLACLTQAEDGMIVEISGGSRMSFSEELRPANISPDPGLDGFAAAFDFGTTTIAGRLYDRKNGELRASVSASNHQSAFGDNVLARLQAAAEGDFCALNRMAVDQLDALLASLCKEAGIELSEIGQIAVSGNPMMEHCLAGQDPTEDAQPVMSRLSHFGQQIESKDLGLSADCPVYLSPVVSPLLGGDVLAGLQASGAAEEKEPVLYCDLGTNIEMILGCGGRYIACTADAGAVLKASMMEKGMIATKGAISGVKYRDGEIIAEVLGGGKAEGICGSGMISALGVMISLGLIDEQGRLPAEDETEEKYAGLLGTERGQRVFYLTPDHSLYVTREDISRFQVAKGAVYAGIQVLLYEAGLKEKDIAKVYLAGGFSSFSTVDDASAIGLIPETFAKKAVRLGNASALGTAAAALCAGARETMEEISRNIRVVELPTHPVFDDAYVEGMMFI